MTTERVVYIGPEAVEVIAKQAKDFDKDRASIDAAGGNTYEGVELDDESGEVRSLIDEA